YRAGGGSFASVGDLLSVPGLGQEQVRALADRVTTTSGARVDGRINVNTASEQVLAAVPGIGPALAAQIAAVRTERETGFETLGDLLAPDALDADAFRQAARYVGTRSSVFLVRAMGAVPESPAVTAVEALVERTDGGTRVLRWERVDRAPGWIAWAWPRQAADEEQGAL
ncbi:MAG: helix-hairpin-helix domain-containing protein, partial [Armatimonadetes bacterium]|nr:helix-hairpin-helix domain-containing protein [Armatimonadota bacterium]